MYCNAGNTLDVSACVSISLSTTCGIFTIYHGKFNRNLLTSHWERRKAVIFLCLIPSGTFRCGRFGRNWERPPNNSKSQTHLFHKNRLGLIFLNTFLLCDKVLISIICVRPDTWCAKLLAHCTTQTPRLQCLSWQINYQ